MVVPVTIKLNQRQRHEYLAQRQNSTHPTRPNFLSFKAEQQQRIATLHLALDLASQKDFDELLCRVNYLEQQRRQLKQQT
ncbi:hypothetical protein [Prochlorococcus marinus]|uniref:hypothetical protein n=1 Tax=Prochlorococcus marinus TaxID=1219 RepID=UPI0007B327A9|nr:hypothetical protein [Prochlorococcus marinus]